jgi:L,D-transpeptidase catalytic domain
VALGVLAAAVVTAAAVPAARARQPAARRAAAGAVATLSNLRTLSRWAYPEAAAGARRRPSLRSRPVGRLRLLTAEGQPEVYLVLDSYTAADATWLLVPIPGRPNGTVGWVPAAALGELHVTRDYLRVNRETFRATLYRRGRVIWQAPIGVGRPSLPTPPGRYYVTEKLTTVGGPFYGPYALGTSAYSPRLDDWPGGGVVGIHGTDKPRLVPGRPSHGCIRVRNADITRLWNLISVGTPIEIV